MHVDGAQIAKNMLRRRENAKLQAEPKVVAREFEAEGQHLSHMKNFIEAALSKDDLYETDLVAPHSWLIACSTFEPA